MTELFAHAANINWYLLPLVVAFSLVYGASRYEDWRFILIHAFQWSLYIVSFLGATHLVLLLVSWDIPAYFYIPVVMAIVAAFFFVGRPKPQPIEEQKKDARN